jgi:flagellar basal body P-ring formation protein FlgA
MPERNKLILLDNHFNLGADGNSCRMTISACSANGHHVNMKCIKRLYLLLHAFSGKKYCWAFLLAASTLSAAAATDDPILQVAEQYAYQQTQNLAGKVMVTVDPLDPGTYLTACSAYQAFTPRGARLWGRTRIGVRCLGPSAWTVLVPTTISVAGTYFATARAMTSGQTIQAEDLVTLKGDLSALPGGIVQNAGDAIGKSLKISLAAGQVIRAEQLIAPTVIRQGETVKVTISGPGFAASNEGRALNNAVEGDVVQVRTASGQVISGIARHGGLVEIRY